MRIGGQPGMLTQFVPEVLQMLLVQAAFQIRAGVLAGRGMALEVDKIPRLIAVPAVEEMVVAHFGQRGERRVGGDMAADAAVVLVGAHHHGHGVPADQALDTPLDGPVAGVGNLFVHRNGVDIRRLQPARSLNPVESGAIGEAGEQVGGAFSPSLLHDAVQGFQPFAGFLCVRILAGYEFCCKHGFEFGVTFNIALVGLPELLWSNRRWNKALWNNEVSPHGVEQRNGADGVLTRQATSTLQLTVLL